MSDKSKSDNVFQLRRVGLEPSHPNVKDCMRLDQHLATLGRHSSQDFFLDSKKYEKLISRRHAEIQRTMDGKTVVYTLYDKSLNGTYVNDIRVAGSVVLKQGDIVMFGHLNGINIKPGEKGPQHNSEFKFVFERVGNPERLPDIVSCSTVNDGSVSSKKSKQDTGKKRKAAASTEPKESKKKKSRAAKEVEQQVEWNTGEEPCAAPKCLKPVGSLVNWVQCDDCDQWFHTECMKVDLDALGDDEYKCGCV